MPAVAGWPPGSYYAAAPGRGSPCCGRPRRPGPGRWRTGDWPAGPVAAARSGRRQAARPSRRRSRNGSVKINRGGHCRRPGPASAPGWHEGTMSTTDRPPPPTVTHGHLPRTATPAPGTWRPTGSSSTRRGSASSTFLARGLLRPVHATSRGRRPQPQLGRRAAWSASRAGRRRCRVVFPNTVPRSSRPGRWWPTRRRRGTRPGWPDPSPGRWLADFCGPVSPSRRAGMGQIFVNDVDDAIADVRFAAEHGLRGGDPPAVGAPGAIPRPPSARAVRPPLGRPAGTSGVVVNSHSGSSPDYGDHLAAGWSGSPSRPSSPDLHPPPLRQRVQALPRPAVRRREQELVVDPRHLAQLDAIAQMKPWPASAS